MIAVIADELPFVLVPFFPGQAVPDGSHVIRISN